MNATWEIQYGGVRRPISEWGISDATLEFRSFEVDTFTYTRNPDSLVPNYGESLAVWRDGQRVFTGIVDQKPVSYEQGAGARGTVKVVGPVWWLAETKILEPVTDANGVTSEQAEIKFPTGDLRAMIQRLLDRATAQGLPIQKGSIAPMFSVMALRYGNKSYLAALVDMVRSVPDSMSWVDYSGTGTPTFNIGRRGSMPEAVFRLGRDAIRSFSLVGRRDLQPSGVTVKSAGRNAAGNIIYNEQSAGSSGRRAVVVVSGPSMEKWTPPENLDQVALKTTACSSTNQALFYAASEDLAGIKTQYGSELYAVMTSSATGAVPTGQGWLVTTIPTLQQWQVDGVAQATGAGVLANAIIQGDLPPWWKETGAAYQTVRILRRFIATLPTSAPASVHQIASSIAMASYQFGTTTAYFADISIEVKAIAAAYASLTTIYRPGAFEFLQPPAFFAQNLFNAQNFMPYEGQVVFNPAAGLWGWQNATLSIAGAEDELASAKALVQSCQVRLKTGEVTLRCGAPARTDLGGLMGRTVTYGNDNLVTT